MVGPDLTGKIIAAVDARRGFASRHVRRFARVARLGLAAALVLVVGAVAAVERIAPNATRLAPAPAPLSSALSESRNEVASSLGSIASTIESFQVRVRTGFEATAIGHPAQDIEQVGGHAPEGRKAFERSEPGGRHEQMVLVGRIRAIGTHGSVRLANPGAPEGASAPRVMGVSFALSSKSMPQAMTWTMDMAPRGSSTACEPGMVDAEGRCAAFNVPLGIWRADSDIPGPYMLPGRQLGGMGVQRGSFGSLGRGSIGP